MRMPLTEAEKADLNKPSPPSRKQIKRELSGEKKAAKKKKRLNKKRKQKLKLENLEKINHDAAGLDIGAQEIYACVPQGRDKKNVRKFNTFTADLEALGDWLGDCSIKTVAMESTGVYWIPIFEILESRGFDVNLVNARQVKNVPGKKSDVMDCQWIQQLHSYGLLQASFRPAEDMCALRAFIRHREMLVKYRAIHVQHMQKSLEVMNLKLCSVITDITGTTGMKIIRSIVNGVRDSVALAQFRDPRCASTTDEIAKSLEGSYKPEYVFTLQQSLELYDNYTAQIESCDAEIKRNYSALKSYKGNKELEPLSKKRVRNKKNKPSFDLRTHLYEICGVDLTMIDGIDALTVQTVISEIGLDMSKWRTVKHFTSWLGLCPCNKLSGGKVLARGSKKIKNRASLALRVAARSLWRSNSALGAFYRRMRAKHGPMKANLAAAHKIARIIYFMLRDKKAYDDPGEEFYLKKYRDRIIKNMKRKAATLGFNIELKPAEQLSY